MKQYHVIKQFISCVAFETHLRHLVNFYNKSVECSNYNYTSVEQILVFQSGTALVIMKMTKFPVPVRFMLRF